MDVKSLAININKLFIDSRLVTPGSIFVAIAGDRFDGHDFIAEALSKGAKYIVCRDDYPEIKKHQVVQIRVANTIQALGTIAEEYRKLHSCPIIAVTGSNGKTSVKEMILSILPEPSLATQGNLNNHIGVPLSLLRLNNQHLYAVFELGANQPGDIKYTVGMVKPDVALINNIAPAHLAGFVNIDGVAREKSEIYAGLGFGKTAIINEDDAYAEIFKKNLINQNIIGYSINKSNIKSNNIIYAKNINLDIKGLATFDLITPVGSRLIKLKVPGLHFVSNALAAAACTYALGIDLDQITAGLTKFAGVSGRLSFKQGKQNSLIIDDTYNANLKSVLSALDVLSHQRGTRILVLGDMGELGEDATSHHHQIGLAAKEKSIDKIFTCGNLSKSTTLAFGSNAKHYFDQTSLIDDLQIQLNSDTTILVKGSRQASMELIVKTLVE